MGVTSATMSLAIDRLERKGYVVRHKDAKDRRRVHLRLTTAGVRVREANSVLDPNRVEALVARLSDEEQTRAIEGLGLLARAAQEQMHATQEDGRRKAEDGRKKEEA
jgi:MarR family 2-MHQ and catechol resistance regulon transcriptional repressor